MERGAIVEMGPPAELAARRGAFARLMLLAPADVAA
jgi:ABC-type multidrug transport system fused ATPase/permease subunit